MRRSNLVLALTSVIAASVVVAGELVDKELAAKEEGRVQIRNTRGEVKIIGWDKASVRVVGELDDLAEEFIFEVDDDVTSIRIRLPRRNINHGDGSDLEIFVPRSSRVTFRGVSTDVVLRDVDGGAVVRSVSGEIHAKNISKLVQINTVSGDVDIEKATGTVKVSTVSGTLNLNFDAKDISVHAVSGDMDLDLGDFDSLTASSVSGEVEIEGHLNDQGTIEMHTVSGDIDLRLSGPINAMLEVKTGPGGDISNDMSDTEPTRHFPASMQLDCKLGNGSGLISVHTVNGDVHLQSDD